MISLSIIGNLGKDAEVKEVNGKKVINFSVCHTETRKDKDGNKINKSTWVECGKWGETTAVAPYLTKGTKVFVEGVPDVNVYKNKEGECGGSLRLLVNKIELLGGGEKSEQAPGPQAQSAAFEQSGNTELDPLDKLPF